MKPAGADGRIIVVGATVGDVDGKCDFVVLRLRADGHLHPDFDGDGIVKTDFGL